MDKNFVDRTITDFTKKIYSFALSKTMDIDEAEELAAKITFVAYKALLKADQVHNVNSYIYRIARNVYAQSMIEEKKDRSILSQLSLPKEENSLVRDLDLDRIRKDISYLSKLQREIVVMYYFQKYGQNEIANRLKIDIRTVRWHLLEARNQIKDGFLENQKETNGKKDIILSRMRQSGKLSPLPIDMSFYLYSSIAQNIAYAVYHEPKTIVEIAREINVPAAFVEDEISYLVNNGFINKLPGKRFQTNIYINKINKENDEKKNKILSKYAKLVCDIYIPSLFDAVNDLLKSDNNSKENIPLFKKLYTPKSDFNFLMWSVVTFACWKVLCYKDELNDLIKFMVKRKDGGENIAMATVLDSFQTEDMVCYEHGDLISGYSSPNSFQFQVWRFFSQFDERTKKSNNTDIFTFENLYDFMIGKIKRDFTNIDRIINLYEKGYIDSDKRINLSKMEKGKISADEYVNLVISALSADELVSKFPKIPDELISLGNEFDNDMFNIQKDSFPEHKRDLCKVMNLNSLSSGQTRVHILQCLLDKGFLKPLKKNQKLTVNMIMFANNSSILE